MHRTDLQPDPGPPGQPTVESDRAALALAEAAFDLAPAARRVWLDSACCDSPDLRARVAAIVEAGERADDSATLMPDWLIPGQWAAAAPAPGDAAPRATRLNPGDRFGKYRVERFIAAGGMGEVYEAVDDALGRRVAIKLLSASSSAGRSRRFMHEAGLMARLEHPGIARLYEWSQADLAGLSTPFIAMEFIDGRPITDAAAELPDARARAALCRQVCEAVEYAHSRGVIHRDLKPANIMVDGEGRARVLDFGIGSLLDPAERAGLSLTGGGPRPGTLAYMSPEQLRGGSDSISTRSDVYSLGLVLYEMLAGRPAYLFRDEPIDSILHAVLDEDPPALGRVIPECRGDLEAIVSVAIRKEPEARYASAAAFGEDLSRYLNNEPVLARSPGAWERVQHFARRHRALTASLAAAALALGAGLTVAAAQYRRAIDAEREAQKRLTEARGLAKTLLFDMSDAVSRLPASGPLRAMMAERAVQSLAPLAEGTRDPDLLAELSQGYTKLATVLGVPGGAHLSQFSRTGDLLAAAASLAERAVLLNPDGVQGWMALGTARFVKAMTEGPDRYVPGLRETVAAYRRALEVCAERTDTPDGYAAAERLAYTSMALGGSTDDPAEREREFQSSSDLYDRLLADRPGDYLIEQSRAILLRSRGAALVTSDPEAARPYLEEASKVFAGLLASDPDEYSSVRNRSLTLVDLSVVLVGDGHIEEAFRMTEDAADAIVRSAAGDPDNGLKRNDHLESYWWKSQVRILAAQAPGANREDAARWAQDAAALLEEGIGRIRADSADPSPRDTARLERFEKGLRQARELAAVKP